MKIKLTYYILTSLIFLCASCGTDNKKKTQLNAISASVAIDSLHRDTVKLKETFNEEDVPVNEYLTDKLRPIRKNFKKINSATSWTKIDTKELQKTTEGGQARFYYQKGKLEKIVTRNFGETFQQLTEYYLLNGKLSFVLEKSYKYNRPIYYDSTEMKENNDTETFDFEKSQIMEDRSYFENGELIHKIESGDCGAPFAKEYLLKEQKRITSNFKKLIERTMKR